MSRLVWGALADRTYESGLDRGVLYPPTGPGVAWIGLTTVTESPTGGEPKPFYLDAVKYLNLASAEEFEATIEALNYPPEFAVCDGVVSVHLGLFATQQPRKAFGFSYRVNVGTPLGSSTQYYKIHIVYNALAAPSQRTNKTMGDSADPLSYSWAITTLPPSVTGLKRTSHFVVDSKTANPTVLATLEDILYGTDVASPSLPTPDELIAIFA